MTEKLLEKRSLSGIFFRFKNPETNVTENRCFEDLPEYEQDRVLLGKGPKHELEWARDMAKILAKRLRNLGDTMEVTCEDKSEDPEFKSL